MKTTRRYPGMGLEDEEHGDMQISTLRTYIEALGTALLSNLDLRPQLYDPVGWYLIVIGRATGVAPHAHKDMFTPSGHAYARR